MTENGTFRTAIPEIFACGECVTAPDLAVLAVGQGRLAAAAIDRFLQNRPSEEQPPPPPFNASYGNRDDAPKSLYLSARTTPRVPVPELPATERRHNFSEVNLTYTADEARNEAGRCMQCKCRATDDCQLRELATAFGLADFSAKETDEDFSVTGTEEIRLERKKCIDCGICVRILELNTGDGTHVFSALIESCPTGALCKGGF